MCRRMSYIVEALRCVTCIGHRPHILCIEFIFTKNSLQCTVWLLRNSAQLRKSLRRIFGRFGRVGDKLVHGMGMREWQNNGRKLVRKSVKHKEFTTMKCVQCAIYAEGRGPMSVHSFSWFYGKQRINFAKAFFWWWRIFSFLFRGVLTMVSKPSHIYFIASVYRKCGRKWEFYCFWIHIHISTGIRPFPLQYQCTNIFQEDLEQKWNEIRNNNMIQTFDVVFILFIFNLKIELLLLSIWFKVWTKILKYIVWDAIWAVWAKHSVSMSVLFLWLTFIIFHFEYSSNSTVLFLIRLWEDYRSSAATCRQTFWYVNLNCNRIWS